MTPCVLSFDLVPICTMCAYIGSMCYLLFQVYTGFSRVCLQMGTDILFVLQVDHIQAYFESCITVKLVLYPDNKAVSLVEVEVHRYHTSENIQNF